jgi:cell division protein FtsA
MFGPKKIFGLDLGSHSIQLVAAQPNKEGGLEILGAAQVFSEGMRRGLINDLGSATRSIREVSISIEEACGLKPDKVFVSLGGTHLISRPSRGMVAVALPDGEITGEDVLRVINAAKAVTLSQNREILQVVPREFVIDGEGGINEPMGMYGMKLEVSALVIDGVSSFIKNIKKSIEACGLEVTGFLVGSLASARAALTKRQREVGVALLDIGSSVTGLVVFEDGHLIHYQMLPVGSSQITEDLAINMQSTLEVAEKVKLEHGVCLPKELARREIIDLSSIEEMAEGKISRKEVARIIEKRMSKIFDMANQELKKIDRAARLPAGAILSGGGAKIPGVVDLAKRILKLPVQIGYPQGISGLVDSVDDPSFMGAVGLALMANDAHQSSQSYDAGLSGKFTFASKKFFKKMMPS